MKKSATSLENIKKITAFLNAFNDFLNKQNGVIKIHEAQAIQDLHKVPYSIMKVAKDIGYFTKIDVQKYQSNFVHFEPIHARTLIEAHKVHRAEKEKQKKLKMQNEIASKNERLSRLEGNSLNSVKVKVLPVESFIVKEKQVAQEDKKQATKQRVFSLLWGLIKFNY